MALTHTFCGIVRNGLPSGFHARPSNKDPPSAEAESLVLSDPIRCFNKESVLGIQRKAPDSGHFCFFPDNWSKTKIVDVTKSIYKYCKQRDRVDVGRNTICGRNYKGKGFDIIIGFNKIGKKGAQITSAYATLRKEYSCNKDCEIQNIN